MKPCTFAGGCPREAVVSIRIATIGDRHVCQQHHDWMQQQGMDFRVLEPNAFIPEWRTRSLVRDLTPRTAA
jgi:hypothetical protein